MSKSHLTPTTPITAVVGNSTLIHVDAGLPVVPAEQQKLYQELAIRVQHGELKNIIDEIIEARSNAGETLPSFDTLYQLLAPIRGSIVNEFQAQQYEANLQHVLQTAESEGRIRPREKGYAEQAWNAVTTAASRAASYFYSPGVNPFGAAAQEMPKQESHAERIIQKIGEATPENIATIVAQLQSTIPFYSDRTSLKALLHALFARTDIDLATLPTIKSMIRITMGHAMDPNVIIGLLDRSRVVVDVHDVMALYKAYTPVPAELMRAFVHHAPPKEWRFFLREAAEADDKATLLHAITDEIVALQAASPKSMEKEILADILSEAMNQIAKKESPDGIAAIQSFITRTGIKIDSYRDSPIRELEKFSEQGQKQIARTVAEQAVSLEVFAFYGGSIKNNIQAIMEGIYAGNATFTFGSDQERMGFEKLLEAAVEGNVPIQQIVRLFEKTKISQAATQLLLISSVETDLLKKYLTRPENDRAAKKEFLEYLASYFSLERLRLSIFHACEDSPENLALFAETLAKRGVNKSDDSDDQHYVLRRILENKHFEHIPLQVIRVLFEKYSPTKFNCPRELHRRATPEEQSEFLELVTPYVADKLSFLRRNYKILADRESVFAAITKGISHLSEMERDLILNEAAMGLDQTGTDGLSYAALETYIQALPAISLKHYNMLGHRNIARLLLERKLALGNASPLPDMRGEAYIATDRLLEAIQTIGAETFIAQNPANRAIIESYEERSLEGMRRYGIQTEEQKNILRRFANQGDAGPLGKISVLELIGWRRKTNAPEELVSYCDQRIFKVIAFILGGVAAVKAAGYAGRKYVEYTTENLVARVLTERSPVGVVEVKDTTEEDKKLSNNVAKRVTRLLIDSHADEPKIRAALASKNLCKKLCASDRLVREILSGQSVDMNIITARKAIAVEGVAREDESLRDQLFINNLALFTTRALIFTSAEARIAEDTFLQASGKNLLAGVFQICGGASELFSEDKAERKHLTADDITTVQNYLTKGIEPSPQDPSCGASVVRDVVATLIQLNAGDPEQKRMTRRGLFSEHGDRYIAVPASLIEAILRVELQTLCDNEALRLGVAPEVEHEVDEKEGEGAHVASLHRRANAAAPAAAV